MRETHADWNAFVATHAHGTILQTTDWGRFKADFGWDWELVRSGEGGALLLFRRLPLGLGTIAYVPRGPVVDKKNEADLRTIVTRLEERARARRAWALWLEPEWLEGEGARERLRRAGFAPSTRTVQPPRTLQVDLHPEEETLLSRMKSKTRYNIRLAGRKGVTVREGAVEDAQVYYHLMEKTGKRNEFSIHSQAYYRRALEIFLPQGEAALLIAEVEGDPVAAIIVFALGKSAWYFYGASSNRHREKMPTYALQWEAMRWAKRHGCTTYDLWGIPDADRETLEEEFTQRSDGLWGVYRFKRGFGGQVVRYVGLWEKTLSPLYPLALRARGLLRRQE